MNYSDTRKHRILFFGEGVSLAHVARPLVLAQGLDCDRYEIAFATSHRYGQLVSDAGFPVFEVPAMSPDEFMNRLSRGAPLYDYHMLVEYVDAEWKLIEAWKPDLIVGDFRVSLGISAERAGIPYANLCNAHWSPASTRRFPVPDLPVTRVLGSCLGGWLVRAVAPMVFRHHVKDFNRLRKEHGLAAVQDIRAMYTRGTLTWYLDLPELSRVKNAPASHEYLGPVIWSPPTELPDDWSHWRDERPLVYITLGSSGDCRALKSVLAALAELPVQGAIATAGRPFSAQTPGNVMVARYLPDSRVLNEASACVFNGGAATGYQALNAGVPVLALPSNADQFFHSEAVIEAGAGLLIRATDATPRLVTEALKRVLLEDSFEKSAQQLQFKMHGWDAVHAFREAVAKVLSVSQSERVQVAQCHEA